MLIGYISMSPSVAVLVAHLEEEAVGVVVAHGGVEEVLGGVLVVGGMAEVLGGVEEVLGSVMVVCGLEREEEIKPM